ncbi:MAG: DUF167 domain-containing protein [Candidatus Pacebacteria bacterium]|nr:DUF167 domain-containing protein [Candidatus Paceibacterota bacterium]
MKVFVTVKTKAREDEVEKIDENHFKVKVKELPVDGKANKKVMRLLANYFKVPLSDVSIVSGHKSSKKRVEII